MPNAKVRSCSIAAAIVCALGAFAAHGDDTPVQAIWKTQEIKFYYQKIGDNFSCGGFQRKLKRVLKELGAPDAEMQVTPAECGVGEQQPLVSITLRTPVEATPEAIAAAGNEQPFAATWKPVSLSRGRMGLEASDCGMVDQLKQLLLPKLAIRVVDDGMDCYSTTISATQPKLKVEALVPAS